MTPEQLADFRTVRHQDHCNMWVGCQQCDGPDYTRNCTCTPELLPVRSDDSFLQQMGIKPE